jgi:DnaK suppressor protein
MSRRSQPPEKAKKKPNGSPARAGAGAGKPAKPVAAKAKPGRRQPGTKPIAPANQPKKAPIAAAKSGRLRVRPVAKPDAAKAQKAPATAKPMQVKVNKNGTTNGKPAVRPAHRTEIMLPAGYRPSEREPFMNELQRTYFRQKLVAWKEEILREGRSTLLHLHEETGQHADLADRATSETDRAIELRARDRQRKLIAKIDLALLRIEDGTYGYCEETGEPIGLKRLDARPIATLSLEAQERHERRERVYRDERAE